MDLKIKGKYHKSSNCPPSTPDLFFSSMCDGGLFESGADLISRS